MVTTHINDDSVWPDWLNPEMQILLTVMGSLGLVVMVAVGILAVSVNLRERANQRIFDSAQGKLAIGLNPAGRQVRVEGEAPSRIDRVWLKVNRSRKFRIEVEGGEPITVETLLDVSTSHFSVPSEIGEWHRIDDLIFPRALRDVMSSEDALVKAERMAVYEQGIASPKLRIIEVQITVRLELTCRVGTLDKAELVLSEHKSGKEWR